MSKIQQILEQRVEFLRQQEAELIKSTDKLGKEINRLSSEKEQVKGELENLKIEAHQKKAQLERELKEISEEHKRSIQSIEDALTRRSQDATEREKGINVLQDSLDASMTQFMAILEEYEKNNRIQLSRDEKLTIYVKNLWEIVKMIFAIIWEMGKISQTMDEGITLAKLSKRVYEKMEITSEEFATLVSLVNQEQEYLKPQREWIAQETIKISDQWKQIEKSKQFISSKK